MDRPFCFPFSEGIVEPQRLRAMQITHAVGNEAHVDILDRIVAGGDVQTLDAAVVAVVEVDIHGALNEVRLRTMLICPKL